MVKAELIIENIKELVTCAGRNDRPRVGMEMSELNIISEGAIACHEDKIVWIGKQSELGREVSPSTQCTRIEGSGMVVTPGFIDPHTHLIFAGSREKEFVQRIEGKTYMEIAASGGGILSTVQATRSASREELKTQAINHIDTMMKFGTTTSEAKSGYGLDFECEIKMLEVIQELSSKSPMTLIPTFLGAHEIPPEFKGNPDGYVELLTEKIIPEVSRRKLAKFCDVFCEKGVFTPEQSEKILMTAKKYGLTPKIHADELSDLGGAELAVKVGAISADHLLYVNDTGIRRMAEEKIVAILLPGTPYFLSLGKYAPARKMIENGVPVALATDFNPGSCFTESLPLIMNIACTQMRMTPAEALIASTVNAAWAVGESNNAGSLQTGRRADFNIFDIPNYIHICYHFGVNLIKYVFKKGKMVYQGK